MAHKAPGKSFREGISLVRNFRMFPDDTTAEAWVVARRCTRHDAVRCDDAFIGQRLVALRVRAGETKASAAWSMRMEARSAPGHLRAGAPWS